MEETIGGAQDRGNDLDFDFASSKLPTLGPMPADIKEESLEQFLWKQRERRRIFCQEMETYRHDWSRRRQGMIDELQSEQGNCETQLQNLQQCMDGRGEQVEQLHVLMGEVRKTLETTRKETGQGTHPRSDSGSIQRVTKTSTCSSSLAPSRQASASSAQESVPESAPESAPLMAAAEGAVDPLDIEGANTCAEPDSQNNTRLDKELELAVAVIGKSTGSMDSCISPGAQQAVAKKARKQKNPCRRILFFENEHVCKRSPLARLMCFPPVEAFCIAVIAIHAVVMGANAEYNARNWTEKEHPWFVLNAEMIFYIWYVTEVVLRLLAFRLNFFTNSDWNWNCFDLMCVLPWQLLSSLIGGEGSGGGMSFFRVVRMLKMIKMLRVIRLMRFFRELRLMMQMMTGSLMTLMWTVGMLLMICYVFAIIFMYGMIAYLEDPSLYSAEHHSDLHKHWGSIWKSMCSLYVAMTGGYDWIVVADELKALGFVYYYAFFAFVVFMSFVMMNIILGMYCEAANATSTGDTAKVLAEESKLVNGHMKAVTKAFQEIDVDKSNKISWGEFNTLSGTDERVKRFLEWLDIDRANARQLFRAFAGSSESVDIDVFLAGLTKVKGDASRSQVTRMEQDVLVSFRQTAHFMHYFKDMTTKLYPKCLGHKEAPGSARDSSRHELAAGTLAAATDMMSHCPLASPRSSD